jgi:hypothetical protein
MVSRDGLVKIWTSVWQNSRRQRFGGQDSYPADTSGAVVGTLEYMSP